MANYGSSTLNGAGTGAAIGSIGGPWGAAIGGGVGALAGLFGAYEEDQDKKAARRAIQNAIDDYGQDSELVKKMLDSYYDGDYSLGSSSDAARYTSMLSGYDPSNYVYTGYDDFDKDAYDVNEYYDKNRGNQVNAAANAVQATAAGAGIGRGTGAANAIANAVVNKNQDLGNEAWTRMTQDRQFDYNLWNNDITRRQNELNALNTGNQWLMGQYNSLANDYYSNEADKVQNYLDYYNTLNTNKLNASLAKATI